MEMIDEHLWRVRVRFDQAVHVAWQIRFDDFFGPREATTLIMKTASYKQRHRFQTMTLCGGVIA